MSSGEAEAPPSTPLDDPWGTTTAATDNTDQEPEDPVKARAAAEAVLKLAEERDSSSGRDEDEDDDDVSPSPITSPLLTSPKKLVTAASPAIKSLSKRLTETRQQIQTELSQLRLGGISIGNAAKANEELEGSLLDQPSTNSPTGGGGGGGGGGNNASLPDKATMMKPKEPLKNLQKRLNVTKEQMQADFKKMSQEVNTSRKQLGTTMQNQAMKLRKNIAEQTKKAQLNIIQQQGRTGSTNTTTKTKVKKAVNIDEKILKDLDVVHSKCIQCLACLVNEDPALGEVVGYLEACLPRMDELVGFAVVEEPYYLKPNTIQACLSTYDQLIQVLQEVSSPIVDKENKKGGITDESGATSVVVEGDESQQQDRTTTKIPVVSLKSPPPTSLSPTPEATTAIVPPPPSVTPSSPITTIPDDAVIAAAGSDPSNFSIGDDDEDED